MKGQKLLVICSFSDRAEKMKVPAGFDLAKAKLILQNVDNTSSTLLPYESRVYLWEE